MSKLKLNSIKLAQFALERNHFRNSSQIYIYNSEFQYYIILVQYGFFTLF